jgi:glycosyltransferase 2 family protein
MAAGIDGAVLALLHPNWRLIGAVAYLGCDIAALGAAFVAAGQAIPVDVLVLGYVIGYIANMLPVPGGFGILEVGLAGTLILYGAPATQADAAVVVYHAIAFWVPSLGGLIGYARLRRRLARPVARPSTESDPLATGDDLAEMPLAGSG